MIAVFISSPCLAEDVGTATGTEMRRVMGASYDRVWDATNAALLQAQGCYNAIFL